MQKQAEAFEVLIVLILHTGTVSEVKQRHVIHSHSIACCGVGFNLDGRSLASGDLAGNVWITEEQDYTPKHTFTVKLLHLCT